MLRKTGNRQQEAPLWRRFLRSIRFTADAFAALMMAAMFLTFILQITIRYSARLEWIPEYVPFLEPLLYGWTLEFCLLLWIWMVFWGNAFVVRDEDHVTFDLFYNRVRPGLRRWFIVVAGVAIAAGLALSIEPTLAKFHILRLKKTATLSSLFGDWIRMRHVYAVYVLFLAAVSLRFAWVVVRVIRKDASKPQVHGPGRLDE